MHKNNNYACQKGNPVLPVSKFQIKRTRKNKTLKNIKVFGTFHFRWALGVCPFCPYGNTTLSLNKELKLTGVSV